MGVKLNLWMAVCRSYLHSHQSFTVLTRTTISKNLTVCLVKIKQIIWGHTFLVVHQKIHLFNLLESVTQNKSVWAWIREKRCSLNTDPLQGLIRALSSSRFHIQPLCASLLFLWLPTSDICRVSNLIKDCFQLIYFTRLTLLCIYINYNCKYCLQLEQ